MGAGAMKRKSLTTSSQRFSFQAGLKFEAEPELHTPRRTRRHRQAEERRTEIANEARVIRPVERIEGVNAEGNDRAFVFFLFLFYLVKLGMSSWDR